MISDYGQLLFCSNFGEHVIDIGISMLSEVDGKLQKVLPEHGMGKATFMVNFSDERVEIMPLAEIYLNGSLINSNTIIRENDVVEVSQVEHILKFRPNSFEDLDSLVELYLDGQLPDFLSVANLFITYANYLNISDKQAAFILASIDIPELEIKGDG